MINKIYMQKKNLILFIILFIYSSSVLFGVFHHEPWRDEAHAWMIARESSIVNIISDARYDGVPILWFLVLMPFAKLGMPYITLNILHALIAICAVGLLLRFGKIPIVTKILFIFSYYSLYEYSVIARNYVLTVFLLFAIATIYKKRFEKPLLYATLIVFLYQTNIYSIVAAGILTVVYGAEIIKHKKLTQKNFGATVLMFSGAIFTIILLYPDKSQYYNFYPPPYNISSILSIIRESFVPKFLPFQWKMIIRSQVLNIIVLLFSLLTLIFFFIKIYMTKKVRIIAVFMIGWVFIMNIFIHLSGLRHRGLVLIFIIFLWWICEYEKNKDMDLKDKAGKIFTVLISFLLFISTVFALYIHIMDYKYEFSGARDMAQYIKKNNLEKIDTVAYLGGFNESILAYFKYKKFWYPEYGASGYFNVANQKDHYLLNALNPEDVLPKIQKAFPDRQPLLLLFSATNLDPKPYGYKLIYYSKGAGFWTPINEEFWLYEKK
jgi:hypothetical protein